MEIEPAQLAVVHKPRYVLLARVAITRGSSRRACHELERAFGVERVSDGGREDSAVDVEIVVASATLVVRTYANFFATITLERDFCVVIFEFVLRVAKM